MENIKNTTKAKRDLKIAEIVYYSIGGVALALGVLFSIFGLILLNPTKQNFEDSFLKQAQDSFFSWLKIETNFATAGFVLMLCAIVYFVIVFAIFSRKGDKVEKIVNSKKSRQRQVAFNGPIEPNVVEVEAKEEKSE